MRDYFTEKERLEVVALLKKGMTKDPQLLKFVAEQIFGKATQPIAGDPTDRTPVPILCVPSDDGAPPNTAAQ
jgi:hypothetical protein